MAPVVRFEIRGAKYLEAYEEYLPFFCKIGWLKFLRTFDGYNEQVTQQFAMAFNGEKALICDRELHLSEEFNAKALTKG